MSHVYIEHQIMNMHDLQGDKVDCYKENADFIMRIDLLGFRSLDREDETQAILI